ncbi:MAG: VanZ family protein [Dehalococcoidia bacterium]
MTTVLLAASAPPRSVRWACAILWMVLIFWWSSFPTIEVPFAEDALWQTISRKAAHAVVFGVLALLYAWALPGGIGRLPAAFVLAVVYGLADEFHQAFVPPRHARAFDVVVDAAGALIALVVAQGLVRRLRT